MVTRRSTFPLGLLAVVTILAGCGEPSERCGYDFRGGGEFTITLSGNVEGQATGQGLDGQNLERWLVNTPNWHMHHQVHVSTGITGGLCASQVGGEPCSEGFAGSIEVPAGTFAGAEEATYVGVYLGPEGFMDASLLMQGDYSAGIWHGSDIRRGLEGAAHGVPQGCSEASGWRCYSVDVSWALDPDVTAEQRWECSGGWGGF